MAAHLAGGAAAGTAGSAASTATTLAGRTTTGFAVRLRGGHFSYILNEDYIFAEKSFSIIESKIGTSHILYFSLSGWIPTKNNCLT